MEWYITTEREYINKCVGYYRNKLNNYHIERQAQYFAYVAVADPKKKASIESFWPLGSAYKKSIKVPTQKRLLELTNLFKNFGKQKTTDG